MKTILVVDDFASVRFYHQAIFKGSDYKTLSASNGEDALACLEQNQVDLVMLDLLMPKMNGREFMTRVRKLPRYSSIPILLITSEAAPDLLASLENATHCALLNKPILPRTLIETVAKLLS